MKPVRIRPLADADVEHAAAYLWRENPVAAARFLEVLEFEFETLSRNPGIGSPRYAHVLPVPGLRMWPVSGFPYLIFYFERDDHLDVMRVLHSARDIPAILGEEASGA